MSFRINNNERAKLYGLPLLQQMVYYAGIRPYMDFATGVVGVQRGISHRSIQEELFVAAHPGRKAEMPSRDQIRRALIGLQTAGLIQLQSANRSLVLKCLLAEWDFSASKKAAIGSPYQAATSEALISPLDSESFAKDEKKSAISNFKIADTPPVSGNIYSFSCEAFEKFWDAYPNKISKQSAFEFFRSSAIDQSLFEKIMSALHQQKEIRNRQTIAGQWAPAWKSAVNWLRNRCWEEEISFISFEGKKYERANGSKKKLRGAELLWESCKQSLECEGRILDAECE